MRLTKRAIDAATFEGGTDYRWDDALPGFGLRLYPSGKKSFAVAYRVKGRKRIMILGSYGALTLNQARDRAKRVLADALDGTDTAEARHAVFAASTVADLADRYLREHAIPKKKPSSVKSDTQLLTNHILPAFGARRVSEVTRPDVVALHTKVGTTAPGAANRVIAVVSKMFNLAEIWELRPDGSNPCRHVKRFKERKLDRYLSGAELATLGQVLTETEQAQTEHPSVIAAIRLLLFTGCRVGEILSLRWQDVDFDRHYLHLPDSKTGRKTIYLNPPALSVLADLERVEGNPYILPGRKVGHHFVSINDPWGRIRTIAGLEEVRLHDLRHTFASMGVAAGFSLPIIGKMLGHTQAVTTERYAHLAADPIRRAVDGVGGEIAAALGAVAGQP